MNPLFQEQLKRNELLALAPAETEHVVTIAVHRNHSFELVASVVNPFLALARTRARFIYGPYDDSLSFAGIEEKADIHLLWVDAVRYGIPDIFPWLYSRIDVLRATFAARGHSCKVIAAVAGTRAEASDMPDTLFLSCDAVVAELQGAAFDSRLEPFTGTRFSNQACLLLARELGVRSIPDMLFPPLKALILDLDNTLYEGVLGEDGLEGVIPYMVLQEYIADLGRQGFLLALASRNEEEDVRRLFAERKDFVLQWEDFSARILDWRPKSESILAIARALCIGTDAVLFVDDNHGERVQVHRELPEVRILAADGPEETLAALRWFPGLHKTSVSLEDTLRRDDLKANKARETLRRHLRPEDYIRELGIVLDLAVDPPQAGARVYELLHKTNQFVLALKRPSQEELAGYFTAGDRCVITVSMRDRLSDSGLIAVGLFRSTPGALGMDELVVSCRALGRGVEDSMIRSMIKLGAKTLDAGPALAVAYRTGPRNKPALDWLHGFSKTPLEEAGTQFLIMPAAAEALPQEPACYGDG